jgi:GR25 family glycosyltransferase involved in LPS biosynthesis
MERLYKTTPDLKERATRFSAIEGKKLALTPSLARLFRPHDFMWKKAIMGCALSHLSLWWKLLNEHQDVNTFLILEDDVEAEARVGG